MTEFGAEVVVLPDPSWVDRSAAIQALANDGLSVLDVDTPVDSKSICATLIGADLNPPIVVLAHADSCLMLPAVALSLRTQHRDTSGYVLIDPDAPPATDTWPESPVLVLSSTDATGTSLRGWPVLRSQENADEQLLGLVRELRTV
jgi:hypothetical protein